MQEKRRELISVFQQLIDNINEEQLIRLLTYAKSLQDEPASIYIQEVKNNDGKSERKSENSSKQLHCLGIEKGNNLVELLDWKSILSIEDSCDDFNIFKMKLLFKNCAAKSIRLDGHIDCFDGDSSIVKEHPIYSPNIKGGANWNCYVELLVPKSVISFEIFLEDQFE